MAEEPMRRSRTMLLALVAASSCAQSSSVFLKRPWTSDQTAIIVLADANGRPIEKMPRVFSASAMPDELQLPHAAPFRIYARTYRSTVVGGPDFIRCPVQFGGMPSDRLMDPIASYVSPLISADASGEVALSPDPQPIDLDLHQPSCTPPMRTACDLVTRMSWSNNAATGDWTRVRVIGPDVVVVRETDARLLRIAGGTDVAPIVLGPSIGMPVELASDHVHAHFGIGSSGKVFQLGDDGGLTGVFSLPFSARGITVARDGHAYAYGDGAIVEIVGSATTASDLPPPPNGFSAILSVSSTRCAALANGSVYVLQDRAWAKEAEAPADARLFGDQDVLGFVSSNGVSLRNEARHIWEPISAPQPTLNVLDAVAIGRGRVLVTGDGGTSGIWEGTAWCTLDSLTVSSLNAVDATADHKAAFTVSDQSQDGVRRLIRFDLSAL